VKMLAVSSCCWISFDLQLALLANARDSVVSQVTAIERAHR